MKTGNKKNCGNRFLQKIKIKTSLENIGKLKTMKNIWRRQPRIRNFKRKQRREDGGGVGGIVFLTPKEKKKCGERTSYRTF